MTRRWADDPQEDRLLSRLYQRVAEQKTAQLGAGHDIAAGLGRYLAWLSEHVIEDQATEHTAAGQATEHTAEDEATLEASRITRAMALHPSANGVGTVTTTGGPGEASTAPAATRQPAGISAATPAGTWAGRHLGPEVAALYRTHARSLIDVAVLLVTDITAGEEVVHDAFAALNDTWKQHADHDLVLRERALFGLYRLVLFYARLVLREGRVGVALPPTLDMTIGEYVGLSRFQSSPTAAALQALSVDQREVFALRYVAEWPDGEIAAVMGISEEAVKSHAVRALSALGLIPRRAEE